MSNLSDPIGSLRFDIERTTESFASGVNVVSPCLNDKFRLLP